ncbi:MAG: MmgE/PrpD family protein [Rhodobacteraceae bacterium]|nr:MmgE/PrpD family protein [Paracoccaceae bacterium]
MSQSTLLQLADLVSGTRFADFDDATRHKAKLHLLDTIGVAMAGSASAETALGLAAFAPVSGASRIWGTEHSSDARTAALLNGISAHALELDDSGGCDHSGAVVVPAVLASLPYLQRRVAGSELLQAILIGYEVARRVLEASGGYETHNGLGWHSTGTCGPFGAAAAVGVLKRLDAPKLAMALAIAGSMAGGTWAFIHNGSQTKKLHSGRSAEGGVIAADLAAVGFSGPDALFEDVWGGFFSTFMRVASEPAALLENWGDFWRLNRCSIKPHATCRGTHSSIDALDLVLRRENLRPEDVARVDIRISRFQHGMCGGTSLRSRAEAQMSIPYALAARLEYGTVGLDQLEAPAWSSPKIARWIERFDLRIDPNMADEDEPAIAVTTVDNSRHEVTVAFPLGAPQNPLSEDRIIAKFEALCGRVMTRDRTEALRDLILAIENSSDVAPLLDLMRCAPLSKG